MLISVRGFGTGVSRGKFTPYRIKNASHWTKNTGFSYKYLFPITSQILPENKILPR